VSDRGEYRGFYVAMADDEDVHALSDRAFRVLTMLKLTLPAIGIGVVYPAVLAQRCGCTPKQLEAALVELESAQADGALGWIARERNVVWLVNGLRYEPTLNVNNAKKHRPFVQRQLNQLGAKPKIVATFRKYYAEWFVRPAPEPVEPPNEPEANANGRVTEGEAKPNDRLSIQWNGMAIPDQTILDSPPPPPSPPRVVALVEAADGAVRPRLPAAYWPDLDALIAAIPAERRAAWLRSMAAKLDGLHPPAVTPDALGEAIRAMMANGAELSVRLFDGYVRRAAQSPPLRATGTHGPHGLVGTRDTAGVRTFENAMRGLAAAFGPEEEER
jgi:hypothetical protein